jgi:cytochrome P450
VRFFRDPLGYLREGYGRHGPIHLVGAPLPPLPPRRRYVFALGPRFNREVLSDPVTFRTTGQTLPGPKGSAQRRLRYGLTRSQGEAHERQRELVLPLFQRAAVDRACPSMVAVADELLGRWRPGQAVDMHHEMKWVSLRLSSDILFGRDDPARALHLGEMIGEWVERNFDPAVWLLLLDVPGTPYHALLRHAERLEAEIRDLLERRRRADAPGGDAFSLLVRAHAEGHAWMADRDLVGQATILFAASYETTENALAWTLFLLAQHPELTEEIAEEIARELGAAAPAPAALARLPLLDAAIRESMRILPPVPYTIRSVEADVELGGARLRRGDRVVLSHYVTHHLPELYPEPERFWPQRWLELRRTPYEYLPFSAGPRLCIGFSFATAALKVVVARILQRFRFALEPGTRIDPWVKVTLAPRQGLPMTLHAPGAKLAAQPVRGRILDLVDLPAALPHGTRRR